MLAEEQAEWQEMKMKEHVGRWPLPMPDYREDPVSPWAHGCPMAPCGSKNRTPLPYVPAKPFIQVPLVRAPAPSTARALSPVVSTDSAKKKRKAQGVKLAQEEQDQLDHDIKLVVNNFKPEYKHKIICEEERDTKNKDDKELYLVACWLPVNKPTPQRYDLASFKSTHLRKLAQNCGVKGGGNLTRCSCVGNR
jgi:hypothetical protein